MRLQVITVDRIAGQGVIRNMCIITENRESSGLDPRQGKERKGKERKGKERKETSCVVGRKECMLRRSRA